MPPEPHAGSKIAAVERFDDLDNEAHDRHRREELASALTSAERELAEEVLVDKPERVLLRDPWWYE